MTKTIGNCLVCGGENLTLVQDKNGILVLPEHWRMNNAYFMCVGAGYPSKDLPVVVAI